MPAPALGPDAPVPPAPLRWGAAPDLGVCIDPPAPRAPFRWGAGLDLGVSIDVPASPAAFPWEIEPDLAWTDLHTPPAPLRTCA